MDNSYSRSSNGRSSPLRIRHKFIRKTNDNIDAINDSILPINRKYRIKRRTQSRPRAIKTIPFY